LQFHALAVQLDGADLEVYADGRDEGRCEGVFAEAEEAAGLADARVADEEEFDLEETATAQRLANYQTRLASS
jgi:hypothetical protein